MLSLQTFVTAIQRCGEATTQVEKLAAIRGLDEIGQRLVVEALSPFRTFHVKKVPKYKCTVHPNSEPDATAFLDLLDALATRQLSGKAALKQVVQVLQLYSAGTADVLKRVLVKNLKCGASDTTFNKVYPNLIPIYQCMGAASFDEKKYQWEFPLLVDAKYDGNRITFFIFPDGTIENRSRNGLPVEWVDGLFDDDLWLFVQTLNLFTNEEQFQKMESGVVVDAEVIATTFKETQKSKGSKNTEAKKNLRLKVFDVMSFDDWDQKQGTMTQLERHTLLEQTFAAWPSNYMSRIDMADRRIVNSYDEAYAFYKELLSMGYEGAILKRLGSYYLWNERNRTDDWTKWKPFYDCSAIIYDVYNGNANSTFEYSTGGFRVVGQAHTGEMFVCDCGGGLSQQLRGDVAANPEQYIGLVIDLKYQEISLAEDAEFHALRFSCLTKFRPDLNPSYFTDPRVQDYFLAHGGKGVAAFKEQVSLAPILNDEEPDDMEFM